MGSTKEKLLVFTDRRVVIANVAGGVMHALMKGPLTRMKNKKKAESMLNMTAGQLLMDRKNFAVPYEQIDHINIKVGSAVSRGSIIITLLSGKSHRFRNTSQLRNEFIMEKLQELLPDRVMQVL